MVRKLLKHEFIYYFRSFGVFLPIVFLIAAVTRISLSFADEKLAYEIAAASSVTMLAVSCTALIIFSLFAGIVRFYKNMYSAEGYLTFTLPVSNAQHIFVKLVAALACIIICAVTVAAAVFISTPIDSLGEFFGGLYDFYDFASGGVGTGNAIAFIIEGLLIAILYTAYCLLLGYACITVGQTAKKHRILKAIGAYYVYYIAGQVIGTTFSIAIASVDVPAATDKVVEVLESADYILAGHIVLWAMIFFFAFMCAVFWLVTQYIMKNKLNLE
ncbi:MAG: hypothetical protein IJF74_02640 [Clostridia bacterium]|nr:hypothetical protein [Clostridia bacterium]